MTRVNPELVLPDALATVARQAGLLEPTAVESMVRTALRRKWVEIPGETRKVLAPPSRP